LKIYISQGSVATRLTCGGIIIVSFIENFLEMYQCRIFKICEYLVKIWTTVWCLLFTARCT